MQKNVSIDPAVASPLDLTRRPSPGSHKRIVSKHMPKLWVPITRSTAEEDTSA